MIVLVIVTTRLRVRGLMSTTLRNIFRSRNPKFSCKCSCTRLIPGQLPCVPVSILAIVGYRRIEELRSFIEIG